MDVAIRIPDEVGRALMARGGDVTQAVLEAVAIEGVPIRRYYACASAGDAGFSLPLGNRIVSPPRSGLPRLHDR